MHPLHLSRPGIYYFCELLTRVFFTLTDNKLSASAITNPNELAEHNKNLILLILNATKLQTLFQK